MARIWPNFTNYDKHILCVCVDLTTIWNVVNVGILYLCECCQLWQTSGWLVCPGIRHVSYRIIPSYASKRIKAACPLCLGWILLMTTNFWKPIGSSKLIRHPRCDFFSPVNSTGRGVPSPPSTCRLQLLCQCFPGMQCENRTDNVATDWWDLHKQIL